MALYKFTNISGARRGFAKPVNTVLGASKSITLTLSAADMADAVEIAEDVRAGRLSVERKEDNTPINLEIAVVSTSELSDEDTVVIYDDFIPGMAGGVQGSANWVAAGTGGVVGTAPAASVLNDNRAGVILLNVVTANQYALIREGAGLSFAYGNGALSLEADVYVATSSETNRFRARFGYSSSTSATTDDGAATRVGFLHDSTNSNFWQCEFVHNNVVLGTLVTDRVCTRSGWVRLKLEVSDDGKTATFWINNVVVGAITADYTPLEAHRVSAQLSAFKLVGTGTTSTGVDWVRIKKKLLAPRPLTQDHSPL